LGARSNDTKASEYDRWLEAFQFAYDNAGSFRNGECPSCGRPGLRLVFVVDKEGSNRGTAVFWCDYCNRGLIPLASVVPDGAETVLRGTEKVPNYTIVAED
jgi:hypothetical protein